MDTERIKYQIGTNISSYRKEAGLTQANLAEKLNYSDKAVSKWERGESIPDVITLMQLAEQFGITVNELLVDPNQLPGNPTTLEKAMSQVSEKALRRKANKNVILGLSSTLVWFVALLFFVVISSFGIPKSWVAFIYGIPINAIVLLSLRSAWHDFRWNKALITAIVWGSLLSVYISLYVFLEQNVWKVFLLGIPGQIAIFLWFRLFRHVSAKKGEHENEQTGSEKTNP